MSTDQMTQMHDIAPTFDEIFARVNEAILDGRRTVAAYSFAAYPDRNRLSEIADEVLLSLGASLVEVNVITDETQTTIAGAPHLPGHPTKPLSKTLCVATLGTATPLAVDDIENDPVAAHARGFGLTAWASAPVVVNSFVVGSICALETDGPRKWGSEDQNRLVSAAARITQLLTEWNRQKEEAGR